MLRQDSVARQDAAELQFSRFHFPHWYPLLADGHTAESKLVPLTRETAKQMQAIVADQSFTSEAIRNVAIPLNALESQLRESLAPVLQDIIDSFGPSGCFLKVSGRSPKDAILTTGRAENAYLDLLQAEGLPTTQNDKLALFMRACGQALCQRNALEALRMFLVSERIQTDIAICERLNDFDNLFFVFRKWSLPRVDAEFRLFIREGRLLAVSQYLHIVFSTQTRSVQHALRQVLLRYHDQVLKPRLHSTYDTYAVDLYIQNFESGQDSWIPQVIEVNPFYESTDEGLFGDSLGQRILQGSSPDIDYPVLRVCERPQGKAVLSPVWREAMQRAESQYQRLHDH